MKKKKEMETVRGWRKAFEVKFLLFSTILMDANETHRVAQGCNLSWIVLTALKFYFPVLEKHHRILNIYIHIHTQKRIQQHYVLMMVAMRINDKRNFHLLNIFQFKNFSIFFTRNSAFFCNIFLENVLFFYLSQWTLYTLWITCQKMTAFWFSIGDHTIWLPVWTCSFFM